MPLFPKPLVLTSSTILIVQNSKSQSNHRYIYTCIFFTLFVMCQIYIIFLIRLLQNVRLLIHIFLSDCYKMLDVFH
ncbi:hypothetical protein HanHA300_Chr03g0107021 [Helianthus annuus]|nr:hypothetical protein HanHA300_Chr03g0107021 [Helianthus annuus]KAJ0609324.1 hypothetical protein HanHA89_Chr03g0118751 [Helianthus annuus]KAJ0769383.1 hypothetical protein HanLR1_Chr03g0112131 [Helianthus annuus]KAJ0775118.1 hypothetical protein HanOQP8_Chr03g0119371 [Helianthus annuus]